MRFSNPQECVICKEIFLTPHDLISHFEAFHSNRHNSPNFSTSATTAFHHYPNPNPNRNLNLAFPVRNNFDFNYYCHGYLDSQARSHKGFFPSQAITPAKNIHFLQPKKLKLMDLPATSSKDIRTLPLLCQLEKPISVDTVTEYSGANSSSIDLSLRL